MFFPAFLSSLKAATWEKVPQRLVAQIMLGTSVIRKSGKLEQLNPDRLLIPLDAQFLRTTSNCTL